MIDFRNIGEQLRRCRLRRNLTLAQVAEAVGFCVSKIANFESAELEPSLIELSIITDFYGVPIYDLIGDDLLDYQIYIGESIKKLMMAHKQTLFDLSQKSNIDKEKLTCYVNGTNGLNPEEVERLSKVLEVDSKYLMADNLRSITQLSSYLEGVGMDEKSVYKIINYIFAKCKGRD